MADISRRRMRSARVAIGVTAVVAASLSGCSTSEDYTAVCVDEDTMERVSDDDCDDDNDGYGTYGGSSYVWYYLGSGRRVPSLGSRVSGGSTSPPGGSSGRGSGSSSSGSGSDTSSGSGSRGSSSSYGDSSTDYGGFGGSSGGVSS